MQPRTSRNAIAALLAASLIFLPATGSLRPAAAASKVDSDAPKSAASTTEKDQTDVSVTVYNSNLALVRDVRQIHLQAGVAPLRFEGVAASINPATVHFRSLSDPSKLAVVEQNYEYDLLDAQKMLQKYVGREVTIEVGGVQSKALLLADNNGPVWKIGDEIVTGLAVTSYRFPEVPGNLYSQPTLVWTLDNHGPEAQRVEASYLTDNMSWNADYVLTVGRDEKTADLDGWVTLTNNSGAAYNNARLQLVAGEVHRTERPVDRIMVAKAMNMAAAAPPQFEQEAFSEYHLYTLQRSTSIQDKESKQISLLSATSVPVEKYLAVETSSYYYRSPQGIGNAVSQPVQVFYRLKNEQKGGLGMPLPAGTVRVYQADSKGGTQFAGEDTIGHTPKDEALRIYVGNAFDVVCERKQTDYKKLTGNQYEMEYEVSLRNHKDTPVTVEIREPVGGDWKVVDSNFQWTKLDSSTIGFQIPVEKDGAATLTYRVRVKW